jgi:hypothetical protein
MTIRLLARRRRAAASEEILKFAGEWDEDGGDDDSSTDSLDSDDSDAAVFHGEDDDSSSEEEAEEDDKFRVNQVIKMAVQNKQHMAVIAALEGVVMELQDIVRRKTLECEEMEETIKCLTTLQREADAEIAELRQLRHGPLELRCERLEYMLQSVTYLDNDHDIFLSKMEATSKVEDADEVCSAMKELQETSKSQKKSLAKSKDEQRKRKILKAKKRKSKNINEKKEPVISEPTAESNTESSSPMEASAEKLMDIFPEGLVRNLLDAETAGKEKAAKTSIENCEFEQKLNTKMEIVLDDPLCTDSDEEARLLQDFEEVWRSHINPGGDDGHSERAATEKEDKQEKVNHSSNAFDDVDQDDHIPVLGPHGPAKLQEHYQTLLSAAIHKDVKASTKSRRQRRRQRTSKPEPTERISV